MPATVTNRGFKGSLTKGEMVKANAENFNVFINGRAMRDPKRMIYIHSVAKKDFGPLTHLLFPRLILRGCTNGERYVTSAVIPDPIPQASPDQERGGTRIDEEDGWRACIDLLNPNNPTNDPYWNNAGSVPAFVSTSQNCNLIAQGVWPSLHEKPPEVEIRRAEKARDDRYRAMTTKAIQLASKSRKDLNEYLQTYPEVHTAMDALGLKADWHQTAEVSVYCPYCGDEIRQGIAFHQSSAGVLCVLDHKKAFKAGAITIERFNELESLEEEDPFGNGESYTDEEREQILANDTSKRNGRKKG